MMKKLTATVFAGIAAMMLTITAFTGPGKVQLVHAAGHRECSDGKHCLCSGQR